MTYLKADAMLARLAKSFGAPPEFSKGEETVVLIYAANREYRSRSGTRWQVKRKTPEPYEHISVLTPEYKFKAQLEKGAGQLFRFDNKGAKPTEGQAEAAADSLFPGWLEIVNPIVLGNKNIAGYACQVIATDLKDIGCYAKIQGHKIALEYILNARGEQNVITLKAIKIEENGCVNDKIFEPPKNIKWK